MLPVEQQLCLNPTLSLLVLRSDRMWRPVLCSGCRVVFGPRLDLRLFQLKGFCDSMRHGLNELHKHPPVGTKSRMFWH